MCRICWNTEQWRRPSGSAAALETGSYVSEHGFGHEEWLFNFEWMIDGQRNGFIQGIHKYFPTYEGKTFPILLYTISRERKYLAVAHINSAYVPTREELNRTLELYDQRGWVDQMRQDLQRIDITTTLLDYPNPIEIANVRFSAKDIRRFDPMPEFIPRERGAPNLTARYMAFDWDGDLGFLTPQSDSANLGTIPEDDPRRSEALRTRAAQQGTEVDPKHIRMQNLLYNFLKRQHKTVAYEENFIDLIGRDDGSTTYYELKTEPTAKMCIRLAIGQLLEYSNYPHSKAADRLVVVGEAPATEDDQAYLTVLRERFQLPIHYGWFRWESGDLVEG